MSTVELVLVAVGGGVGAVLRFVLDGAVRAHWPRSLPLGTIVINVSGSLVLGYVTGLGTAGLLPSLVVATLGTGMMGGYTTFSTASVETVQLVRAGHPWLALLNGIGMLVVSVGAAALGLLLGRNT
ncbi:MULTISPECIES: CrcB family protein [unclassified Curtobacterium]|uniref:fluoride efflux transporter FluC n=1 Tax=unclassified Curtobacterium TaxID=257496 RepID=UPI000DA8FF92|nr:MULTISPECIES: CrcB family protein [unclassified Curtobacterium]PZE28983.1 chromosome condensation protein CrcB [Curtobacterium sp. MCBD17_028]PZE73688.1 chromosome condensation protein CrcB [Curtobacterium sp. MCBD17_019]WIB62480.1 CrcB family protein [Curtobacterium sp. MCBD17_040]WIE53480.1 CrcB family protein [Curtobacterium sp. MCBD17_003]